jgi:TolA-binding protein
MEAEDIKPHLREAAAAPQPAAGELHEALAAAVVDLQQQMQQQEERVEQLQQQLNNLQLQGVHRQEEGTPQPGNERPPFLVRRPVARKLF